MERYTYSHIRTENLLRGCDWGERVMQPQCKPPVIQRRLLLPRIAGPWTSLYPDENYGHVWNAGKASAH